MNKIKILHIGMSSNMGGIESVLISWTRFKPSNIIFDFINLESKALAYEEELVELGCTIYRVTPRKKNPIRCKKELKEIIINGKYDYVHHHIMSLSWLDPLIIANRIKGTKCILHSHSVINNNLSFKYKILHYLGMKTLKNIPCLKVSCGDEAGKTMFVGYDYRVIQNGIDIRKFKYRDEYREKIRKKYNIKDEDILIGHVGRPGSAKNYPFLIEVFSQLVRENNNYKLMLIGAVDNDSDVQKLIEFYNVKNNVVCPGRISNTYMTYSAMDLFFFPSLYEGVSVALIEAQASGLKCVVSENVAHESAVSELVEFIKIDNINLAVKAIKENVKKKSCRSSYTIQEEYDIQVSAKKIFRFYEEHL